MASKDRFEFAAVFDGIISEIEAPEADKQALLIAMEAAFDHGDSRSGIKASKEFFDKGYTWPRYEAHIKRDSPENTNNRDHNSVAELFHHRVEMSVYERRKAAQRVAHVRTRPYWRIRAAEDDRTPDECLRLHGVVHRYDSPFWVGRKIPCERLFCRCVVVTMSEKDYNKHLAKRSGTRGG